MPSGPTISARLGAGQVHGPVDLGREDGADVGLSSRSRTIGVDAMFSATAIIRCPRSLPNSPVDAPPTPRRPRHSTTATTTR